MSGAERAGQATSDTNPGRGSFVKFVLVSAAVLAFLLASAAGLFYALWITRSPDYTGPAKLENQEKPTVGFR